MTIYLDIVFIENILMNYIIIFTTGVIQKNKNSNIRTGISSAIGAVYAILEYLKIIPIYSNIFMKILLSVIMIYIAFYPANFKKLCKSLVLFYLVSFAMGGCAFALLYFISPQNVSFRNGVLVGTYPMKITIIAGLIGFIIIQCSFSLNKRLLKNKDLICNLEIGIMNDKIKIKAYIDSGNTLKDPITKMPVIIVEKQKIEKIIDVENLIGGDGKSKFRLIPFKSIGKQNGMLTGIRADYVKIIFDEEKILKNVIIGIYDKKISKNYSALIGLDLLEGEYNYETIRNVKQNI